MGSCKARRTSRNSNACFLNISSNGIYRVGHLSLHINLSKNSLPNGMRPDYRPYGMRPVQNSTGRAGASLEQLGGSPVEFQIGWKSVRLISAAAPARLVMTFCLIYFWPPFWYVLFPRICLMFQFSLLNTFLFNTHFNWTMKQKVWKATSEINIRRKVQTP